MKTLYNSKKGKITSIFCSKTLYDYLWLHEMICINFEVWNVDCCSKSEIRRRVYGNINTFKKEHGGISKDFLRFLKLKIENEIEIKGYN